MPALWRALHDAVDLPGANGSLPPPGSLVETLIEWAGGGSLRFMIVVDNFDVCAAASFKDPLAKDLIEEILSCLSDKTSPAHFVMGFTEDAEPLWTLLSRYRIVQDGLDQHRLKLPNEHTVEGSYEDSRPHAEPNTVARAVIEPVPSGGEHTDVTAVKHPLDDSTGATRATGATPRRDTNKNIRVAAGAACALAFVAWVASTLTPSIDIFKRNPAQELASKPSRGPGPALAPSPSPIAMHSPLSTSLPRYALVVDASESQSDQITSETARLVTPVELGAASIHRVDGWSAKLSALKSRPEVAVMTYDSLQAARRQKGLSLQVVSPLFSEEIYFVVRSDSPLKYVHETKNASFNVGPAAGQRAFTANAIYRAMFGEDMRRQANDASSADVEHAINELLRERSDRVVVLVGAQPNAWLSSLPAEKKQRLRLLELDPTDPTARKAGATFLTARVKPEAGSGLERPGGTTTYALMSFLVASTDTKLVDDSDVRAIALAACRNLSSLVATGHPKWREVEMGLRLETGWPVAAPATEVFTQHCG